MMRFHLARLLILFTALWLPLQTAAAIAMPYCQHATHKAVQHEAMPHCQHASDNAGHAGHSGNPEDPNPASQDGGHTCSACGFCHLAGGAALPAIFAMPAVALAHDYSLPSERPLVSHIPEQPQRPPRFLA